jgi:hypothetical protein
MTTAALWRQVVALANATRAGTPALVILRPQARPVPGSMVTAGWLIAVAAIVAVAAAAAIRWPTAVAAAAFRAGHAAGMAWATLRSFGSWLLSSIERMIK